MKWTRFEDLDVWQSARTIVKKIYQLSNLKNFKSDWALRDQIRRAAISIMSNIAEGFSRFSSKEFTQFMTVAKGSIGEVRSQLYIALDQDYLNQDDFDLATEQLVKCEKMCSGLIRYLKNRG